MELSAPVEKGHLEQRKQHTEENVVFAFQYHPALPNLKKILMGNGASFKNYIGLKIIKMYPGLN